MGSDYQKFAKDVITIGVCQLLVALSGILLLPLITKTLGAHDYGIWSQVQVTIGLVFGFAGLGLPFAMTRFLAAKTSREEIQEEFYSVFSLVFLSTLIVSIILMALADFFAGAFFEGATDIVRITGLIILVHSLNWVYLNFFRTFRQMKKYSIFMIADNYGQIGLIAYLALSGYGLFSVVLAVLAIRVAIFFFLFFFINSQIRIRSPRFSRIREYLAFSLPTIPGLISAWFVGSSDRYVIGYFLGAASIGVYSAGYTLGSAAFIMVRIFSFVLPPTLSRLYDEGRIDEVKTHLSYSLKFLLLIIIPFIFGAVVLSKQVLLLFSTPQVVTQGYYVVPLVALAILLLCFCEPFGAVLTLVKKTKISGIAYTLAALVNLGLNILLVPIWGILAAAITTIIAYSLLLGINVYYSRKEFSFDMNWRFIAKSLIASLAMSLVIWWLGPEGSVATVVTVVIGVVVYGVILFLLRGFSRGEFRFFRGLFQSSS